MWKKNKTTKIRSQGIVTQQKQLLVFPTYRSTRRLKVKTITKVFAFQENKKPFCFATVSCWQDLSDEFMAAVFAKSSLARRAKSPRPTRKERFVGVSSDMFEQSRSTQYTLFSPFRFSVQFHEKRTCGTESLDGGMGAVPLCRA